ncbi:hypothetical protein JXO52_02875 [bacterium]|nr:hypothetical protein [bacterium]
MEPDAPPAEKLCDEIRDQSQKDADAVLEQARKESARLIEEARKRAGAARAEVLEKAAAQAEAARKRILSGVHLEIKKRRMAAQETVITDTVEHLRKKLLDFRKSDEYGDFLDGMIAEGAASLNGGRLLITAGDRERTLLSGQRLKRITAGLKKQYADIELSLADDALTEAGVVMVTADGRMRFDNRFSTRLQRMDHSIRLQVSRFLEEAAGR